MSWVVMNHAEDGLHASVFRDRAGALAEVERQTGAKAEDQNQRRFYDDWGRYFVIEERPDGWSAAKEQRLKRAYDKRECGLRLSAAERAVLNEFEYS
jgi:hypothetical protein